MGRAAVRVAVANYFENANFSYVGKVLPSRPGILRETDYTQLAPASPNGSSSVLIVNIQEDTRVRKADTGRGAVEDQVTHRVVLEIYFGTRNGSAIDAQADYDLIIDQIFDVIRANAVMNAPEVIWSAGEYQAGISHEQSEVYTAADGATPCINGIIRFDAMEWVAGEVVAYPLVAT